MSGEVSVEMAAESESPARVAASGRSGTERVLHLEQEVESLRAEVRNLQQQFDEFKKQFE
jgi:uncharacterized protein YceH (UPF0502 family)